MHRGFQRPEARAALKLTISKKGGLSLLPMKPKNLLQGGAPGSSEIESQNGRAQIVDDHSYRGPCLPPGLGAALAIDAMRGRDGA